MSEAVYRTFILSDPSIAQACNFDCSSVRNKCRCPNNRLCKDLFSRSSGQKIISVLHHLCLLKIVVVYGTTHPHLQGELPVLGL